MGNCANPRINISARYTSDTKFYEIDPDSGARIEAFPNSEGVTEELSPPSYTAKGIGVEVICEKKLGGG